MMSTPTDGPYSPSGLSTASQFGRYLAENVRGRRTQRRLSNAVEQAVRARAEGVSPLTVQRISAMENLATARLPTDVELYSYLHGCDQAERFDLLKSVLDRLRRDLLDADRARMAAADAESGNGDGSGNGDSGSGSAAGTQQGAYRPRAAAVPVALAGLPAEEGFVGRADHLAALDAVLAPDDDGAESVVVSTVAGLGGVGKTALAIRAAHRAREAGWFPGGVLFIDLHGYDPGGDVDPGSALAALLGALGTASEHIPGSQGEREALYRSALAAMADRGQRVLVVADNASALQQVLPLRPGSRAHRMLVTSRHTLPVPGARRVELDALPPEEAVAVVARALLAADPGDVRVVDEPEAAMALARLCGYLPLALRITAELLADDPGRPLADFVALLTRTRDLLGELAYDDSVAVRVSFESSYQRLPAASARLFRLLALHPGDHVRLEAAAALADVPEDTARRLAAELRRAHLLHLSAVGDGYRFHDLVRLYAAEQCGAQEAAEAMERLFGYYRDSCHAAEPHLAPAGPEPRPSRFADRAAALAWLEDERPNFAAVVGAAIRAEQDEPAYAIAYSLRFFFNLAKHRDDWIATGNHAVAAAHRLGERGDEGNALNSLATAYLDSRRLEDSLRCAMRALGISRVLGNRTMEAKTLINVGNPYYEMHRWAEALDWYQEALSVFREVGSDFGAAMALNNLGFTCRHLRRRAEAVDYFQQSMATFEALGDRMSAGVPLTNLGATYQDMELFDKALECHRQALDLFVEFRDRHHEGWALDNLGATYRGLGRFEEALGYHRRALEVRRETGDAHGQGVTLAGLGAVYGEMGDFGVALSWYRQAADVFVETNDSEEGDRVRACIAALTDRLDGVA